MSQDFFPEDYKLPKSGNGFMKFEKGESLFRVLDKVVMGYEYWTDDNKVFRSYTPFESLAPNAKRQENKKTKEQEVIQPKHIWVMPVWNYKEEAVQILTVSQKTVQEAILALGYDADWGNPTDYDLKVVREGDGFETKYAVSPKPKKELDPAVLETYTKGKDATQKAIADLFA